MGDVVDISKYRKPKSNQIGVNGIINSALTFLGEQNKSTDFKPFEQVPLNWAVNTTATETARFTYMGEEDLKKMKIELVDLAEQLKEIKRLIELLQNSNINDVKPL